MIINLNSIIPPAGRIPLNLGYEFRSVLTDAVRASKGPKTKGGHFSNLEGYAIRKLRDAPYLCIFTKALYEVRMDKLAPLTYTDEEGTEYRSNDVFETDFGTLPLVVQPVLPKDRFLLSYLLHDSACVNGGLFKKRPGEFKFTFVRMGRRERDNLLYSMILAEGGNVTQRLAVYVGVRAFAYVTGQWA